MLLLMANWGAGEALMVSVAVTDEVSPPPVMVAVLVMLSSTPSGAYSLTLAV